MSCIDNKNYFTLIVEYSEEDIRKAIDKLKKTRKRLRYNRYCFDQLGRFLCRCCSFKEGEYVSANELMETFEMTMNIEIDSDDFCEDMKGWIEVFPERNIIEGHCGKELRYINMTLWSNPHS